MKEIQSTYKNLRILKIYSVFRNNANSREENNHNLEHENEAENTKITIFKRLKLYFNHLLIVDQ